MPGFTSAVAESKAYKISASDTVQGEDTTERNLNDLSYTKAVALRVPTRLMSGVARVVFTLKSNSMFDVAYGRIYKNGAAIGTERSGSLTSYATFTEDLDIGSTADEIQLYLYTSNAAYPAYSNLLSIRGTLDKIDTDWETIYP